MKKEILKIGFVVCSVMLILFAVLLISNSIIIIGSLTNGWEFSKYKNLIKLDTILLFVFGIGTIIFKSIEIYDKGQMDK